MGEAGIASSHGASALFWNPANNVFVDFENSLVLQHHRYLGLFNHESAAVANRMGKGVLGVIGLARVKKGKRFGEEDVTILGRFAELALLALEKAQLITDARRELKDRVETEAILRHSEQLYRSLLESSPDPVVVYDIEGRATHVNPAFEQTTGYTKDEALGRPASLLAAGTAAGPAVEATVARVTGANNTTATPAAEPESTAGQQ